VIDIQEPTCFPDAIEYFKSVYQHAQNYSDGLISIVIFNKVDPQLSNDDKIIQHIDNLKKEISKIVENAEILFYTTSIYDPFSILEAFSKPILGDKPVYNEISVLFANFGITHSIDHMTLMIDDLLEIGSFRIKNIKDEFISATLKFYQQFTELEIDQKLRSYEFEGYMFYILRGRILNFNYTLSLAYSQENNDSPPKDEDLAKILTQIEDALRKYKLEI
jgi:hypothetical protein